MARPIRPAIVSTLILGSFWAASVSGIVLVTTTSVIGDLEMLLTAGPDSTGCEAHAYTPVAPLSSSACAVLTKVPAVSIRSSMTRHMRPLTSPITCITSATLINDGQGRIHFLCEKSRALHATRIRGNHGQILQVALLVIIHQHRGRKQVVHRNIEKTLQLRRM